MRKQFFQTHKGIRGGMLKGKAHYDSKGKPLGGIKAVVTDQGGTPVELESGEAILRKTAMESKKHFVVEGTPKEIASTINQAFDGAPIGDSEAKVLDMYKRGGRIPKEKHKLYLGEEGGMGVSSKGMFEEAVNMEEAGFKNETIRHATSWFRSDLDNLWRYEISDKEMEIICTFTDKEINHLKTKNNYIQRHLKDVIKHYELFKAYPRIKYLKVLFVDSDNSEEALLDVSNEGVMFIICNLKYEREISNNKGGTEELGEMEISDNRRSGEERKAKRYNTLHFRKVITHELQHAIQVNEGLAEGGNKSFELEKLKSDSGAIHNLTEKEQEYIATQRYLNKAGEIEAMSSDVRIDYDDLQRRRNKPYSEIAIDKKYFSSNLETKIKFKTGGSIGDMTPSELKAFYASPEGKKLDAETYSEWKRLVNMTKSELEKFYHSEEGLGAGLSKSEANEQGIDSGRESAEWIMKMKDIPYKEWTSNMWRWAKKQINFIKRMSGVKGDLYDDKGRKTRKHTALLIWGHNPEKKFEGGGNVPKDAFTKSENERNEDYEANWNLWIDTLLKNIDLPIEWTTSESRKEIYGDSFYITIFNEDWQEFAKLRFSGHSVMNTSRLQNEFHNPNISRFYEIVSRAMNLKQQEKHPENLIKYEGGGSIEKEEEMEKEIPKHGLIDDEEFEVIGVNHKLDKVRVKNFASGETFEMPIDKWIVESLELGTQAKFKANGREYVGQVVIKDGQKSISLYKDDDYSGDAERVVPIRDIDLSTLKPTMKKEMFMSGGNIGNDLTIDSFFSKDNDFILDYIVKTLNSDTKHNFSDYKNKTLRDIAESTRDCMFAYSDIDVNNPIRIKKCNDIKVCFKPKENDYSLDELIIYFAHIVTQDSNGKRIFSKTKKDAIIYIINVIQHPEVIYKQSEYSFLFEKKEPINKSNQTFCVVLYTEYVSENLLRIVTILPDQKLNQIENKKEDGKLIPTSFEELRYAISPSVTGVVGNKGELLTDYNANIENKIDSQEKSENKLNKDEMFEGGGSVKETEENEKLEYFKPYKSVEELAELHRVPVSEILEQLHIGEKVEMEHTTDYEIARIIALQHIEESKKYYTLLEGMENKFETGGEVDIAQSNKIVFKPITTPL